MNKLTDLQIGYLAGIIDGEGCISIRRQLTYARFRTWNYTLSVNATNTNLILLKWCKTITGIGIIDPRTNFNNPNSKQSYEWRVHYKDIPDFLIVIKPYLVIKKRQAELVLEYLEKYQGSASKEVSTEMGIARELIYEEMKELNRRGK